MILLGTLALGVGLPVVSARIHANTIPVGAVQFGVGSVVPAEGWSIAKRTETALVLENRGVVVTMAASTASESSAKARLQPLLDNLRRTAAQLTVGTDPSPFVTTQGLVGSLAALAGPNQTAIVASVVGDAGAVDITAFGPSTPFGEAIPDIEDMLRSVRVAAPNGG